MRVSPLQWRTDRQMEPILFNIILYTIFVQNPYSFHMNHNYFHVLRAYPDNQITEGRKILKKISTQLLTVLTSSAIVCLEAKVKRSIPVELLPNFIKILNYYIVVAARSRFHNEWRNEL